MQPTIEQSLATVGDAAAPALEQARALVRAAFAELDPHHGMAHAEDVERNAAAICAAPDIHAAAGEQFILRIAALLHDIGYAAYEPSWSQDRREHIAAGLDFVERALPHLSLFAAQPALVRVVAWLIAYHDDTNYIYPSAVFDCEARPVALGAHASRLAEFERALTAPERERLRFLLGILREADAIAATNTAGAQRTFGYSVERGLPVFAPGSPLAAWCWEESAAGNIRIAAKRLLIDAVSENGKSVARDWYAAAEAFVRDLCTQHGVPYVAETAGSPAQARANSGFRLARYLGWDALEAILRQVSIIGDRRLHPYANAVIQPRHVRIGDLRPAAYYALDDKLDRHRRLYAALQAKYALSLFDLTGAMDYEQDGARFRMGPPLVETYYEPAEGAPVSVLVDGLHRVVLAREVGVDSMWVVDISELPAEMPLVPLPLRWEDVQVCDAVPPLHAKRKFRFPTLDSFPDVSNLTDVPVTADNYLYFFYRDLSVLGSEGIRVTE